MKRDEETCLLLKSESASIDSPKDEYTPLQFENSLGKIQATNVKAPRKLIDVGVLNYDLEQASSAQKDSRNYKKTLLELERLYNILIDVEDCEKKLAALPTGTVKKTFDGGVV
jgi:DNA topoisomerase 2-associated protein PAT1